MMDVVFRDLSSERDHTGDLGELHGETLRVAIATVYGLAFSLFALGVFVLNRVDPEVLNIIVGLTLAALCASHVSNFRTRVGSACLVAGFAIVLTLALHTLPPALAAPWAALFIMLASVLLGWVWGAAFALVVSGLLLHLSRDVGTLPMDIALSAIMLGWSSLAVSWMTSRPIRTTLEWASSSYFQGLVLIRQLRERQAELVRLSKSLQEAYYRLEQLNLDLERARRAAQEARRLKAHFAAAVSHELRTPLNLVIGFCEMMVLAPATAYGRRLPQTFRNDLEAIYRNACHISALVDDILDLSQIDAHRMALHREWTSLAEIVDESVAPVALMFEERGVELEVTLPVDLSPLFVDRIRIRQILINLLSNAVRFSGKGKVAISARGDASSVVIAVSDTGPGIAPSQLRYVFEEFHQLGGLAERRGGSGLGLAVSKRFAELHQGTMWVESVLGQGSTFFLCLPVSVEAAPTGTLVGSWDDRISQRVHGQVERQVLIVDDSPETYRVFARYLDGYRVLRAANLETNDSRLAEPVHAVIVESSDGRERWRELSRTSDGWRLAPVLTCELQTPQQAAKQLGVADYLIKPVTRDHLSTTLDRLDWKPDDPKVVLIVDDDTEMLNLLARMVRSLSRRYRVLTAKDGARALTLMRRHRPDTVLLDLLMPTLDGYAVLRMMRDDPLLGTIPVIVITAKGSDSEEVLIRELRITREGSLTVAEATRWLKAGLDAVLAVDTSDRGSREERPG